MSEFSTAEIHTNERLLRSDVTLEECKKIEKVLRKNNISYFEKWKFHTGLFHVISSRKNSKCDIIHSFRFHRKGKAGTGNPDNKVVCSTMMCGSFERG